MDVFSFLPTTDCFCIPSRMYYDIEGGFAGYRDIDVNESDGSTEVPNRLLGRTYSPAPARKQE